MGACKEINLELLEKVESMKVLEIKPGDTLVVKADKCILKDTEIASITYSLRRALQLMSEVKIIVLDKDMDIGVIRQG